MERQEPEKNWSCILSNLKTKGKRFLCIDLEKTSNVKKENKKVNVNESVKLQKKVSNFASWGKGGFQELTEKRRLAKHNAAAA